MFKHPEQRVGVFVDTANMYHSAKNLYKANVNFGEVLKEAVSNRKLIRAIAYVINSSNEEENTFFDALEKQGFEIKKKELQVFASGIKKADWDVGLAVDCIKMADRLDAVIIVSGDGDYVPLVQYLQENKGCLVEVVAFGETTSTKLREQADDVMDLSSNTERFLIGHRSSAARGLRKRRVIY
ncbi:MAG: NYN domain-containing protein [Parcubacteria group bacterium]|nr:NYN domain-containing protein [Parcubacteria group bacterium]